MNKPLLTKTLIGILLLISNLFSNKLFAQTQGTGIFFQAVARDNFSNPAKDRKIYIQSTIIQSTENGTKVLIEEHQSQTDPTGVFSISIGQGTRKGGTAANLASIEWARGPYFLNLKIAIQPIAPVTNWDYTKELIDLGTTTFGTVPYALYSASSGALDSKLSIGDTSKMLAIYAKAQTVNSLATQVVSKLSATDTATMLAPYAKMVKAMVASNITSLTAAAINDGLDSKVNIADSGFVYVTPQQLKGVKFDTTSLIARVATKVSIADSITQYVTPAQLASKTFDTTSLSNRINLKASSTDVSTGLALKLNKVDTSYLLQKSDTLTLSNRINLKANSTDVTTSLGLKLDAAQRGVANGVASLDNTLKIPAAQIPVISFASASVVANQAAMLALSGAIVGSIAIRTDINKNFVLSAEGPSVLSNWVELATPTSVTSINGFAGPTVTVTTNDINEGVTNKYYTDTRARNAVSASAPLNYNASAGTFSITVASTVSNGYLSSSDFTTFNNKQNALVAGTDYATPSGNITGNAANVTGVVSITHGGTGTSTATGALTNLGAEPTTNKSTAIDLGNTSASDTLFPSQKAVKTYIDAQTAAAGVLDGSITNAKLAGSISADKLAGSIPSSKLVGTDITTVGTITSGTWSGTTVAIGKGGTGAISAAAARTNLGLAVGSDVLAYRTFGTAANNNTGDFEVPLTFTSPLSRVTNTISIPAATTSVNGYLSSADWTTFNAKQTALTAGSGISISAGTISATGLTTSNLSSTAGITNAQLAGSIAASKLVGTDITTVGTITSGTWNGTTIAVANGGTGATTAAGVKTNLGLVIGTDVLAYRTFGTAANSSTTDFVAANSSITGATKTKITYDEKGLVTAGADATTADIAASTNKNYVTDVQSGVLSNTSGTNTGDETVTTIKTKLGITTLSGSNTGDQTITLTGDVTGSGTGSFATTVGKINGTTLSSLNTGILKNTTSTGIPSIAVAGTDYQAPVTLTTTGTSGSSTFTSNTLNIPTYTLAGLGGIGLSGLSATAPLSYNNTSGAFSIPAATTTANGYLSSTDWTTFNAKQTALTAGSGISISGGTISATGLTTSNLSSTAGITNAQLAGSIAASKLVGTDITTVGTVTAGTWSGTTIAVANGGTGLTSVGTNGQVLSSNGTTISWTNPAATGITSINGITSGTQTLTVGTTGTAPAFSSASSTHTLNIPMASTTSVTAGLLSNADWTTFNNKQTALTAGSGISINAGTISATGLTTSNLSSTAGITNAQLAGSIDDTKLATISTGGKVANSATTATNANTASAIVARDASGNFSANIITGTLSGTASTVTTNANLTGDVTSTGNATTVGKINGTTLSSLSTGILKNTTSTGVPSIAAAGTDYQAPVTLTTTGTSGASTFTSNTLNIPTYTLAGLGGISLSGLSATAPLSYNNTSGVFSIPAATTSANGYLSSTDWTTFNNKQTALTAGSGISINAGTISATGLTTSNLSSTAGITNAQLAGSIAASKLVGTDITTVGTITSGTWNGTTIAVGNGGTGLTSVGTNGQVLSSNGTTISWTNPAATGITAINGITSGTQTLTVGTTGTAPAFSSASSTHTLNIPLASTTSVTAGLLSNADWTTFNNKQTALTAGSGISINAGTISATGLTTSNLSSTAGITNAQLAGSIAASKLVGTDITTVGTITSGTWSGTTIAVANGGTGATTAAGVKTNLGLVIGTDVLAYRTFGTAANSSTTDFVAANSSITGATKTKITYDAKGLVTAGADATTADIAASINKNYVTDVQSGVLSNTSGTNTGDETLTSIKTKLGITTLSGSNTGDQTITLTGDVTGSGTGSFATTVGKINGTTLSSLNTGILKNTTSTGIPSIAVAGTDYQAPYANLTNIGSLSNSTGYLKNTGTGTFTYVGSITDADLSTIATAGKISNSATTATNANTASAIVARDASGNFTAGTISGTLSGTATNVSGIVAIANGGTGSSTQNFVDLSTTQTIAGAKTLSGITTISNATASTSTSNGALIVNGGAGITGAVYAGSIQNTPVGSTTASTGSFTTLAASGATSLGGTLAVTGATTLTGAATFSSTVKITTGAGTGKVLLSDANGLASWSNAIGSAVTTSTAAYSITLAESIIFYTGTANGTFSIPAAATANAGKEITIKNKTGYTISITPATGSIYIDNANTAAASVSIGIEASNNWIKLVSDGTQWNVLRALF